MQPRPKLILVEGIPFSGKSTTAEYVATQLQLNGLPAQWVWEIDVLDRFFATSSAVARQYGPGLAEAIRADWAAFITHITASADTFVVDSALSFATVDPLFAANLPPHAIAALMNAIAAECRGLNPYCLHLVVDVDPLLQHSYVERGPGWIAHITSVVNECPYQHQRNRTGTAGVTAFMQEVQALMQELLSAREWNTLTIDTSARDWPAYHQAIAHHLQLHPHPIMAHSVPLAQLHAYRGIYTAVEATSRYEHLEIAGEGTILELRTPTFRLGALIPESDTRFRVQATAMRIAFVLDEQQNHQLLFTAPDGQIYRYDHSAMLA
jgi:hypothetical protein